MAYFGPGSGPAPMGALDPIQLALADTPVPGFSNSPFPNESPAAFRERLQRQYAYLGGMDLPKVWDANLPGGGGYQGQMPKISPLQIPGQLPPQGVLTPDGTLLKGTILGDGSFEGTVTTRDGRTLTGQYPVVGGRSIDLNSPVGGFGGVDPLEQQRQLAFGALDTQKRFYDTQGSGLAAQLGQRSMGRDVPFTDSVVAALLGEAEDSSAGQFAGEQDQIRRAMANAGLSGSGVEASALVNARRASSRSAREGARRIRSQAELENFQAKERAQQQAQQFLAQKAQNLWGATNKEVDLRSRFEVTGQGPFNGLFGGGGQGMATGGNAADLRTQQSSYQAPTGGARYGGQMGLAAQNYLDKLQGTANSLYSGNTGMRAGTGFGSSSGMSDDYARARYMEQQSKNQRTYDPTAPRPIWGYEQQADGQTVYKKKGYRPGSGYVETGSGGGYL